MPISRPRNNPARLLMIVLVILLAILSPRCVAESPAENAALPTGAGSRQSQVLRGILKSRYLDMNVPFMVYLPASYGDGNTYPVWYGLHGYSSTETMWLTTAGIGQTADAMIQNGTLRPMIMVFPLTRYDSAKVIQEDMKDGVRDVSRMERMVCEELVSYIDSTYRTENSPSSRYIGGFSMGGLFALQIALHRPDLFGKVGSYSPALTYSDFSGERFDTWLNNGNVTEPDLDLAHFAWNHGLDHLLVDLDCGGTTDPFAVGAESLYQALVARCVQTTFHKHGGGHSLQLDKLESYLLFYGGVEPSPTP